MLHVMRLSLVWGLLMKKSNRVRRASPSAKHSSRARALQCRIWAFTAERAVVNWHRSFLCILHEDCCLSRPFSLTRSHPKLFHSYTSQTTQLKEGRNERTASLSDQINLASCTFPTYPEFIMISEKRSGIYCVYNGNVFEVPFLVALSLFFSSAKHIYALIIQAALKMKTHH